MSLAVVRDHCHVRFNGDVHLVGGKGERHNRMALHWQTLCDPSLKITKLESVLRRKSVLFTLWLIWCPWLMLYSLSHPSSSPIFSSILFFDPFHIPLTSLLLTSFPTSSCALSEQVTRGATASPWRRARRCCSRSTTGWGWATSWCSSDGRGRKKVRVSAYVSPHISTYVSAYGSAYFSNYVSPYVSAYVSAYVIVFMFVLTLVCTLSRSNKCALVDCSIQSAGPHYFEREEVCDRTVITIIILTLLPPSPPHPFIPSSPHIVIFTPRAARAHDGWRCSGGVPRRADQLQELWRRWRQRE